ncbi:MAG: tetratricopeptide repeat protein, partial [Acidobacteriaceae bacterium]
MKELSESKPVKSGFAPGDLLIDARGSLMTACVSMLAIVLVCAVQAPVRAQTYKIGASGSTSPQKQPQNGQPSAAGQSLGFGSNIQNARLARAAELALQRGDHAVALDYAQRAVHAAPNDPQLWFLYGYAARLDGKLAASANAFSRGLSLQPASLQGLSGLAQTYSLMGRTAEAERMLKKVIASNPGQRDDLLILGDISLRSGDYTTAVDWLRRAEQIRPDAHSELLLAISYQHLKQMDLARHYLNLAKQRAPNNPDVQRSLAGYYRQAGDYSAAIAALKSISNPTPDVTAELGYTYQLDGNQQQAAKLYTQAANARPKDIGLQLSAAQAQVAVGSIEDANPFLERAAQIDPNSYRLHAIRGDIAKLQEHDDEASKEYSAAIAHLPASPIEGPLYGIQLHMNLQQAYRNLNESDLARQQLQIAQTKIGALDVHGPDRPAFLRLRALIKMNAGEVESALNDMKEALSISPDDPKNLQLDGDLLMKLGRTDDAIAVFKRVLAMDPHSQSALTSLGYASRAAGNVHDAEKYFNRLAHDHPSLYVPYLALGDLYTSVREYKKAETAYSKGYALAPANAMIVAGGMDAAIEGHNLDLAGVWLHRLTPNMDAVPKVLSEQERYYSFMGDPQRSAEIGRQAIQVLPHERDVVVYLGYDLLHLGQFDELRALTAKYMDAFPKDPDVPLLAGYVAKHDGHREEAVKAFTEAIRRNPDTVTAYVNRGYVLNDLLQPEQAAADFEQAIKLEPKNGEAHLGLAFSSLQLNRSHDAVRQSELAEEILGDSELLHVIRATAYGRLGLRTKASEEYRAAMKFNPNDGSLYLGLANVLFAQRRYNQAIQQLQSAQKLLPGNAEVYALMARSYANLDDREQTLRNVQLAEKYAEQASQKNTGTARTGSQLSDIYVSTGQALDTLGDQKGAMVRFGKALSAPNSNRVGVRLAIARLMVQQGNSTDAQRQIALALMEAEGGVTPPPTGEQYIAAADILQQMHEYRLSQTYLQRAKAAGASDIAVRVGLANSYLALGDTARAAAELAAVRHTDNNESDYAYLLAQANLYEQEHHGAQALSSFAQAASAAGEDQTAEQGLLQAGANEGFRINPKLSVLSNLIITPIFEDSTIYVLDSKLLGPAPVPPTDASQLPPPRSSLETLWTNGYHLHLGNFPTIGGFFQIRNARGLISVPASNSVQNRNTTDYTFNIGLNPTLHLGRNALTFDSGVQGTLRRDSRNPLALNQNLGRVFTYLSTSSFFNVLSASGYVIYEAGPFTESNVSSKAYTGAIDFRVGAPWGKTALVTGWGLNDQKFS